MLCRATPQAKISFTQISNKLSSHLIYFLTLATLTPWVGLSMSTARWGYYRLSLEIEIAVGNDHPDYIFVSTASLHFSIHVRLRERGGQLHRLQDLVSRMLFHKESAKRDSKFCYQ